MGKIRKLRLLVGVKGILSVASLVTIALALVVYTASVTINPVQQLTVGATADTWGVYINEVDQTRYLPGNLLEPTFNPVNTGTYAFKVVTDATKVCAVKIELTSAISNTAFSKFDITVSYWTGSAWATATLYNAETGSTTIPAINGLNSGAAGYIHHPVSTTTYYLVKVTYSYDLVDATTQVTATFHYTPLPRGSF